MVASLRLLVLTSVCIALTIAVTAGTLSEPGDKADTSKQLQNKTSETLDGSLANNFTDNDTNDGENIDGEESKASLLSGYYPRCPDGWYRRGSRCYHFSRIEASWVESMMYCLAFNGYLAEINDWSENYFLWQKMTASKGTFWVGGTDFIKENHWIWANSYTPITTSGFLGWCRGQPSNSHGNEHCMELNPRYKYWNDSPCQSSHRFICEKDLK